MGARVGTSALKLRSWLGEMGGSSFISAWSLQFEQGTDLVVGFCFRGGYTTKV